MAYAKFLLTLLQKWHILCFVSAYVTSYWHMPHKLNIKATVVLYLRIKLLAALGFCFQDSSLRVYSRETSPRTYLETNLSPFDSKTWKLECIKQTSTIFNALIFSTTSNTRFYYVESMYKLIIWQIIMGFLSSFYQFCPMIPWHDENGTK